MGLTWHHHKTTTIILRDVVFVFAALADVLVVLCRPSRYDETLERGDWSDRRSRFAILRIAAGMMLSTQSPKRIWIGRHGHHWWMGCLKPYLLIKRWDTLAKTQGRKQGYHKPKMESLWLGIRILQFPLGFWGIEICDGHSRQHRYQYHRVILIQTPVKELCWIGRRVSKIVAHDTFKSTPFQWRVFCIILWHPLPIALLKSRIFGSYSCFWNDPGSATLFAVATSYQDTVNYCTCLLSSSIASLLPRATYTSAFVSQRRWASAFVPRDNS